MDKIIIKNLKVLGILGIHPHEQRTPQQIQISLAVTTDITDAAKNDDIEKTVNYSTLAKNVKQFVYASNYLTIEALIEALAARILEHSLVREVWIRIEKPNAVPDAEAVGVEITRP